MVYICIKQSKVLKNKIYLFWRGKVPAISQWSSYFASQCHVSTTERQCVCAFHFVRKDNTNRLNYQADPTGNELYRADVSPATGISLNPEC